MKRWIALLFATALMSGCGGIGLGMGGAQAPAPQDWTHWVCDSEVGVQWRYTDARQTGVDAKLEPKAQVYHLKSDPGADGHLYSDGVLALHVQGSGGLVYWVATNDLIGRGCKAP